MLDFVQQNLTFTYIKRQEKRELKTQKLSVSKKIGKLKIFKNFFFFLHLPRNSRIWNLFPCDSFPGSQQVHPTSEKEFFSPDVKTSKTTVDEENRLWREWSQGVIFSLQKSSEGKGQRVIKARERQLTLWKQNSLVTPTLKAASDLPANTTKSQRTRMLDV